jgi:multidrug efflux pump subunit AcrA (membrane-fusion protein)
MSSADPARRESGADLEVLRRREAPPPARPKRPLLPRLTGLLLLLGLLGLGYAFLEPILFPPQEVRISEVRPVRAATGVIVSGAGTVEAAGWLEAAPFPTTVRPLVLGVVESLDVLEGQAVKKGETVIGRLSNLDVENELVLARSRLALREAEAAEAVAAHEVARSLHEQRLAQRESLVEYTGLAKEGEAALAAATARVEAAAADVAEALVDLEAQRDLARSGGSAPNALERATARMEGARARERNARADRDLAAAHVVRMREKSELAREGLEDPRDLAGAVRVRAAELGRREAEVALARAEVEVAERNHAHLTVLAPMDGTVMRLECAPGAVAGPMGDFRGEAEGKGSTGLLNRGTGALVTLYDPARLQARVDVPYADVVGIRPEMEVELEAHAFPGRWFQGVVDRLVHESDINKAMLQVKVRLLDPDPRLRPEMLVKARMRREGASPGAGSASPQVGGVLVPVAALRGDALFVYDPTGGGRARRVPVRVVSKDGEWAHVEGVVGLSSKVILDEVTEGRKVRPR